MSSVGTSALTNASQLLLRQGQRLSGRRLLLVNPPADQLSGLLRQADCSIINHTQDWRTARSLEAAGQPVHFSAWLSELAVAPEIAVVFLPKSRALLKLLFAMLAALDKRPERVWVVGEKRAGIAASRRVMEEFGLMPSKLDAARHCSLFAGIGPQRLPACLDDFMTHHEVAWQGATLSIAGLPGVFSERGLDRGTRLLLENLPDSMGDRVLDFGCGGGVIGAAVARSFPSAKVLLADASALATETSRRSLIDNAITNGEVVVSDGFSEIGGKFTTIISNPPFHFGVHTDYSVTEGFLNRASQFLQPGGELLIVANSFLDYFSRLEAGFSTASVIADRDGYRVYRAVHSG